MNSVKIAMTFLDRDVTYFERFSIFLLDIFGLLDLKKLGLHLKIRDFLGADPNSPKQSLLFGPTVK